MRPIPINRERAARWPWLLALAALMLGYVLGHLF
jgi:hypothetical protein